MPLLAIVASAAGVPVLDVKTTRETDVLVREILCDIRELGVANSGNIMSRAAGNVRDNVRSDCRGNIVTTRRIATTTTAGAIAATSTSPTGSPAVPTAESVRGREWPTGHFGWC